jgi:hypothetical protein
LGEIIIERFGSHDSGLLRVLVFEWLGGSKRRGRRGSEEGRRKGRSGVGESSRRENNGKGKGVARRGENQG